MMINFFKRENPKNEIEGIDRAMELLNERYEKKQITIEQFQKQAMEFAKKREKYQKQLDKENR